ncbi:hypothetical protein DWV67_16205 [Dorea formicigenerans]|uniref:Uncharacterized protein n=1 Tax=Dorea formicigenerans TaxID=39486 RepID=A0A395XJ93_9FIRM|nr:hypothetical protein DWV67_16205 [Dorea formicigenerans]
MKIYVKSTEAVTVIDKSKKDWEMNGRKGTAFKAICHTKKGDEVQVDEIRITEGVYVLLKPMTPYYFSGELDVRNGRFEAMELSKLVNLLNIHCVNYLVIFEYLAPFGAFTGRE